VSDERIPVSIRATGYLRLHVPDDLPSGPAPCVMALHGYGQEPEAMFAYARAVAPDGAVVVAPEGPQAFYAERWRDDNVGKRRIGHGWIADRGRRPDAEARNRDLLTQALDLAAEQHTIDPARTFLLGYSQGVGVCADFAVHARERVAGLVGLAGGVPSVNRPSLTTLAGLPMLWVTGSRDRFYTEAYSDEMMSALRAAGIDLASAVYEVGHGVLEPAQEAVAAWLSARV